MQLYKPSESPPGVSLYKQGKFQEALDLLLKARNGWSEINPELDKDIQRVKDAINRQ